ncbi:MAG: NAD-binding protein [Chloroflexota bacterium]
MNIIVVGCGRVGAELSYRLFKSGHRVVVVDQNPDAFNRLKPDFRGRTVEGEALSLDVLTRAGIEQTDALAVVTNSDTHNAVVAHAARVIFEVPNVIARNYDPRLRPMLEAFGLHIVGSSNWGAQRIEELLTNPENRILFSAGNGEVEVYEILIPENWNDRTCSELVSPEPPCLPVALTRAGRAVLPKADTRLSAGDILNVSTNFEGITALRARLENGPEA